MLGVNMSAELCDAFIKCMDAQNERVSTAQKKAAETTQDIRQLSDVSRELARAQRKGETLELSKNPALLRDMRAIHDINPSIFGDLLQNDTPSLTKEDLECVVQALGDEIKLLSIDVEDHLRKVNRIYDERTRVIESAKQTLEKSIGETDHIIRKMS
jgi:hypothetical protein